MIDSLNLKLQHTLTYVGKAIEKENALSPADYAGIVQAAVGVITIIVLFYTVWLQKKSIADQKDVLLLERKSKAASFYPTIECKADLQITDSDDLRYGILNFNCKVHQNPITRLLCKVDTKFAPAFKMEDVQYDETYIYSPGETFKVAVAVDFFAAINFVEPVNDIVELEITYSDLVGNVYMEVFTCSVGGLVKATRVFKRIC